MLKWLYLPILCGLALPALGQQGGQPGGQPGPSGPIPLQLTPEETAKLQREQQQRVAKAKQDQIAADNEIRKINQQGLEVQIQSIAHFRGARVFQLTGIGLVVGLEGSGDTTKSVYTQTIYANYLKSLNLSGDPTLVAAKNVALVQVTATIPAFTKPGTMLDVTVSSIGDAKSLQGGSLVLTPLYAPGDNENVIASAMGELSIGGFNVGANGSTAQRNHVNVGRIPGGAELQRRIESKVVFDDPAGRKLFLDLDQSNPITVSRIVHKLNERYKDIQAKAIDSTTVSITIPDSQDPAEVMGKIAQTTVFADTPAKIVINERTGTIVVGGNVEIGPAMVVSGSLSIRIETLNDVSQPAPLSNGSTTPVSNSNVSIGQDTAKVAILKPLTTVSQLARIFQALELKPNDVIQILQMLQQQGALKARIEMQ
jgi:flagellar P-ring protein precursor FlgI